MVKSFTGTIHGNSIQLDAPSGLVDGQRVEVVVTARSPEHDWARRAEEFAGSLADLPNSVDEDMKEILGGRNEGPHGVE